MQHKGSAVLIGIFSIFAIIFMAAIGFLYYQNQKLSEKLTNPEFKTENKSPNQVISTLPASISQPNQTISTPTPTPAKKPVVVYESEGLMLSDDKSGIQSRIINPFIDYYSNNPSQIVVSIIISVNNNPNKNEFPYLASAVFANGGNQGFVIEKKNGQITWWLPECLNGCQFTDSFEAKYPEIVSLTK